MACYSSVLQTYLKWANSLLCERGVIVSDIGELEDGRIFTLLIDVLTGDEIKFAEAEDGRETDLHRVEAVMNYLQNHGIDLRLSTHDVLHGDMKTILDLLWVLILHFTIHSTNTPPSQRTLRRGKMVVMEWCVDQLTDAKYRLHNSISENFEGNNHLAELIEISCSLLPPEDHKESSVSRLTDALIAAEETLGVIKSILSPADVIQGSANEYSILIFLALLKRKVELLAPSLASTSPCEDDLSEPWYSLLHHTFSFKFVRADSLADRLDLFKSSLAAYASSSHTPPQFLSSHQGMEGTEEVKRRGHPSSRESHHGNHKVDHQGDHRGDGRDMGQQSRVDAGSRPAHSDRRHHRLEDDWKEDEGCLSGDRRADGEYIVGDELLELLETIGIKGKQMRQSLDSVAQDPLAVLAKGPHQERVIARLLTELEMLRGENRRLFQELAESKSHNALGQPSCQGGESVVSGTSDSKRDTGESSHPVNNHGGGESLLKLCGLTAAADRTGTGPMEEFVTMTLEENQLLRSQLLGMHATTARCDQARDALQRAEKANVVLQERCAELEGVVAKATADAELKDRRMERFERYTEILQAQNAKLKQHMSSELQGRSRSVSPAEVKLEVSTPEDGGVGVVSSPQSRPPSRTAKFLNSYGVGRVGYVKEEQCSSDMEGPHHGSPMTGRGDAGRFGESVLVGKPPGTHTGLDEGGTLSRGSGAAVSVSRHCSTASASHNSGAVSSGDIRQNGALDSPHEALTLNARGGTARLVEDGCSNAVPCLGADVRHEKVRIVKNDSSSTTSGRRKFPNVIRGGYTGSPHEAGLVPHRGEAEGSSNRATPGLPEVPRCDHRSLDFSEPETVLSDSDWPPEDPISRHLPADPRSSLPVQRLQFNLQRGIRSPSLGSLIRACAAEGRSVSSSDHEDTPGSLTGQSNHPISGANLFYTPQSKRTSRRDAPRSESRVSASSRRYNRFESIALESVRQSEGTDSHSVTTRCCDRDGRGAGPQTSAELGTIPKWRQLRYSRARTLPTQTHMEGHDRNPREKPLSSARESLTSTRVRLHQHRTSSETFRDHHSHELSGSTGAGRSSSLDGVAPESQTSGRSVPLSEGQANSEEGATGRENDSDEFHLLPTQISDHRSLAEVSPPRRQTLQQGTSSSSARVSLSFSGSGSGNLSRLHQSTERSREEYVPLQDSASQSYRGDTGTPHDGLAGRGTGSKADSGISSCSSETVGYIHRMLSQADQSCANSIIDKYLEAKE